MSSEAEPLARALKQEDEKVYNEWVSWRSEPAWELFAQRYGVKHAIEDITRLAKRFPTPVYDFRYFHETVGWGMNVTTAHFFAQFRANSIPHQLSRISDAVKRLVGYCRGAPAAKPETREK